MNAKVSLSRKDELFLINLGLKHVLASALGNPEWGTDRNGHAPVRRPKVRWTAAQHKKFSATMKKKHKTISASQRRKLSAAMKARWRAVKKAEAEAK